jgi:hypothetical protein
MNESETRLALELALAEVSSAYPELWSLGVGERAKVAAVYSELRRLVGDRWKTDLEWNRQGPAGVVKTWSDQTETRAGTPDLIVHQRGLSGAANNLLVAEFKTNRSAMHEKSADYRRVRFWMDEFGYQVGAVASFGANSRDNAPRILWVDSTL